MFCSKCGIKLPNNAKFCFCCGAHMQQFAQKESVRGEERIEKQGDISFVNIAKKKKRELIVLFFIINIVLTLCLCKLFFGSFFPSDKEMVTGAIEYFNTHSNLLDN